MLDKFYVFMNMRDTKQLALTHNREGGNLPQDQGRWRYWKEFNGGLSGREAFGLKNPDEALTALKQQGYYLWKWPRLSKTAA
jgi:hypothetical protein